MKITIKDEDDTLIFSDDHLDNDNFLGVMIKTGDGIDVGRDFSLKEMMCALVAFDAKRSRRLSEEKDY